MLKRGIMFASVFVLCIGMAFAASDTVIIPDEEIEIRTEISGTVTDATTEAPVANAEVTVSGSDASTTTNESGAFSFTELEPGTYTVTVRAEGYEASETRVEVTEERANVQITLNPRQ